MILISGASGYLGSYVAERILNSRSESIGVLLRAKDEKDAENKLWQSLQLHMDSATFRHHLKNRIHMFCGDLTLKNFGLSALVWDRLVRETDSIIHCAASLNRRSEKVCMNVNLKGTLQMLSLAQAIDRNHGLKRFSFVSTVAVAGERIHEIVGEDESVDWNRNDYDPYARTKKFCEHMVSEMLPPTTSLIFRPSIVLGDSRFSKTTQFDMAQAFVWLSKFPVLPFDPNWRLDIVPANFVGRAIADLHTKENPLHRIYHLSSGATSLNYEQILEALYRNGHRKPKLIPSLEPIFRWGINAAAASPKKFGISGAGKLMKAFFPYLTFDTVFDNRRVVEEIGEVPAPFSDYADGLYDFVTENEFQYPYQPLAA